MTFSESIKEYMGEMGTFLKEEGRNQIEEFIRKECKIAKDNQRYNDIITSLIALCDVGVKEDDLYELLSKFWNIDSRSEATEYINIARHLEWPYIRLKSFLKKNGNDNYMIVKYMKEHNVRKKLENNSKLCELPDEKLKLEVEKR